MMRRLSESELSREPVCALGEATDSSHDKTQRAALLAHVLRVLAPQLSSQLLLALRPQLEHAIARGLSTLASPRVRFDSSLASPSARFDRGDP